jgi:hypothetical protein
MHYLCYGRKFKVEKMDTGDWCAVGRARGRPLYVLDKLGSRQTEIEMQAALDAWAKHTRATKVIPPCVQDLTEMALCLKNGGQLELFPNQQRVSC